MNRNNCCGCGVCYNVCPTNAIEKEVDGEGFVYPYINETKCIKCGLCDSKCPCQKKLDKGIQLNEVYACKNRDDDLRRISTSGGFFLAIAKYIIEKNGLVCAVGYDTRLKVVHKMADKLEDVKKFTGSKYVQSDLCELYEKLKKKLEENNIVLFVGTPCQVYALKCYLGEEYEKLITIDIICMGVGSPKIWESYINKLNKHRTVKNFIFKDKDKGWYNYNIKIEYDEGICKMNPNKNIYMKGYLSRVFLRPYCYKCKFKGVERVSDITISDCWGINKMIPSMDDNKGVSAIYIHSEKGKEYLKKIKDQLIIRPLDLQEVIKYNKHIIEAAEKPAGRERFFDLMRRYGEILVLRLYFSQTMAFKFLRKVFRFYVNR